MSSASPPDVVDEPPDSPVQFCADFAAVLDERKVSLRAAAQSGWGRSTIAAARKGPDLPNVELVVDVLETVGEPEQVREQWRSRHVRLRAAQAAAASPPAAASSSSAEPAPITSGESTAPAPKSGFETLTSSQGSRFGRRPVIAVVELVVVVIACVSVAWWLVSRSEGPTSTATRTIVVQNEIAFGRAGLEEDDSPSYLAARPIRKCANVRGCKLKGTDIESGDTVQAVCQLQGAALTNADVRSPGIETNPNVAASALWYGIRWHDGRLGYLSEVYVAPAFRGGLQLPPC